MKAQRNSVQQIGTRIGLYTCAAFIAYFLLMKLAGLSQVPELRYLNFFILLGGVLMANKHYRAQTTGVPLLSGFGLGMIVTAISVIPFSAFLYGYFTYVDPQLLIAIKANMLGMFGEYLTAEYISLAIIMEGLSSGLIMSLSLAQYYKSVKPNTAYSL